MPDGPRIADGARVLSFAALPEGRARLTGFRRFKLRRRQGNLPGDIVYDYDAAHLLHSFVARAAVPCFYDALDQEEDLIGRLVVDWPAGVKQRILRADDAAVRAVGSAGEWPGVVL
jgi:hypothetical protein